MQKEHAASHSQQEPPHTIPKAPIAQHTLEALIGSGSFGVVYRAHSPQDGVQVALKTLHSNPTSAQISSIRREIHTLDHLNHPGLPGLLRQGMAGGVPWYTMELVQGEDLQHWCQTRRSQGWQTEPLREVLGAFRALSHTLAYIHSEGIVHGDIKPDNVLMRSGNVPVLVDFGLTSRLVLRTGREPLDPGRFKSGSWGYMAPELLDGASPSSRTDLYALGCMLYQALTGNAPDQTLRGAPPKPPGQTVSGIPKALDALVLSLMAPTPQQRPGYALDVFHALGDLGAQSPHWSTQRTLQPFLHRSPMAGRERLVTSLVHYIGAAFQSHGTTICIQGESGIGKTRLTVELSQRLAASQGAMVIVGQAQANTGQHQPLGPWRAILRTLADLCRAQGPDFTADVLGPRGALLRLYEPSLADLPGQAALPPPAELKPTAAIQRLLGYLNETLQALARHHRLLIVLDDLQWADALTIDFIARLASGPPHPNMALLLTSRHNGMPKKLAELPPSPMFRTLSLERLDRDTLAEMLSQMLAWPQAPPPLLDALIHHSEGNPLFAAEYLRSMLDQEQLKRTPQGQWVLADHISWHTLPMPRSIHNLIAERLRALSEPARQTLNLLAVMGQRADAQVVAQFRLGPEQEQLEGLRELSRQQIIEPAPDGGWSFHHDLLREVAYDTLPQAYRSKLHQRAATILEGLGPQGREASLGWHWAQAGNRPKALKYTHTAASRAVQNHALEEAHRLYHQAMALCQEHADQEHTLRLELVMNVLSPRAQHRAALELLEPIKGFEDDAKEVDLHCARATALRGLGRAQEALDMIASTPHDQNPGTLAWARLQIFRANICGERGDFQTAADLHQQASDIFKAHGQYKHMRRSICSSAVHTNRLGQTQKAQRMLEQCINASPQSDSLTLVHTHINLAGILHEQGLHEQAKHHNLEAIRLARKIGSYQSEALALMNVYYHATNKKNHTEAHQYVLRARRLFETVGDRVNEAVCWTFLLENHNNQGKWPQALECADKAIALHAKHKSTFYHALTELLASQVERLMGRYSQAQTRIDRSRPLIEQVDTPFSWTYFFVFDGLLRLARGEDAQSNLDALDQQLSHSKQNELNNATRLRLAAAIKDAQQGLPLYHGESPSQLTPEQRNQALRYHQTT